MHTLPAPRRESARYLHREGFPFFCHAFLLLEGLVLQREGWAHTHTQKYSCKDKSPVTNTMHYSAPGFILHQHTVHDSDIMKTVLYVNSCVSPFLFRSCWSFSSKVTYVFAVAVVFHWKHCFECKTKVKGKESEKLPFKNKSICIFVCFLGL